VTICDGAAVGLAEVWGDCCPVLFDERSMDVAGLPKSDGGGLGAALVCENAVAAISKIDGRKERYIRFLHVQEHFWLEVPNRLAD
jgi:hypothetical protein